MRKNRLTRADNTVTSQVETCVALPDENFESGPSRQSHDEGMVFFMHYVAVCLILVLAMTAVLDPFAVLVAVALVVTLGLAVWLSTGLAEMFNEYLNRGEDR